MDRITRLGRIGQLFLVLAVLSTSSISQIPGKMEESPKVTDDTVKLYHEAIDLFETRKPESLKLAREKFYVVLSRLQAEGQPAGRGRTLFHCGWLSNYFGEKEKAIEEYKLAIPLLKLAGVRDMEAIAHNNIGLILIDTRQPKESIANYSAAVEIFKEIGARSLLALAYTNLGSAQKELGDSDAALKSLENGRAIYAELGDIRNHAHTLNFIGTVFLEKGDNSKALERFNQARSILESHQDKQLLGTILFNLAVAQNKVGEVEKAKASFTEALKVFRSIGDSPGVFRTLIEFASFARRQNDLDGAIAFQNEALVIVRATKDPLGEGQMLHLISIDYAAKGDFKTALETIDQARRIFVSIGRKNEEAITLYHTGNYLHSSGQTRKAMAALRTAVQLSQDVKNPINEANALQILAQLLNEAGDRKQALAFLDQAKLRYESASDEVGTMQVAARRAVIYLASGETSELQNAADNILSSSIRRKDIEGQAIGYALQGFVALRTSDFARALELANRSAVLLKDPAFRESEGPLLSYIGMIYIGLGENQKARDILQSVIARFPRDYSNSFTSTTYTLLGNTYLQEKNYEKSRSFYELVLKAARKNGDRQNETIALNNIGASYGWEEKHDKALDFYRGALKISESINHRNAEAMAHLNIGFALAESKQIGPIPLDHLNKSLAYARTIADPGMEAFALGGHAIYWKNAKNGPLAVFYGKQAVNLIQQMRSGLRSLDSSSQQAFIKKFEDGYRELAELLVELGRISEAEKVLSMLKEEEYFEFVRRDGKASEELLTSLSLTADERAAYDQYKKYAEQLTVLGKEYSALQTDSLNYEIGKFPRQARHDELEKLIANANRIFSQYLDQLKSQLGNTDVRVATVESGTQSLLRSLNEPRTVFVSTISTSEKLSITLTTSTVQKAYSVKLSSAELNKLIAEFRSKLQSPRVDPRPAGQVIYDKLFASGLRKDIDSIGADTILWSLDGTLRYIPMSALWDGKQYLVENYRNINISLASRDKLAAPSADRKALRVLGAGVTKSATIPSAGGGSTNFQALPSVTEELCTIVEDPSQKSICAPFLADRQASMPGKSFVDENFTREAFNANVGRFPVIHLASHFSLNPGSENDSFLLLGGPGDRKLSLASIRQGSARFAGVELVTLSACDTGVSAGPSSNGAEVEGLSTLVHNQGAKSVLASLWPVVDNSTKDLMTTFYRNLMGASDNTKGQALRSAQLSMLRGSYGSTEIPHWRTRAAAADLNPGDASKRFPEDPRARFAHPFYWSPFVMTGHWR